MTAAAGCIREVVLAARFGASAEMDAFYFSWALVQSMHDLLFAGSLGAAVVPLLKGHRTDLATAEQAKLVLTITVLVALIASVIAYTLWLTLPALIDFVAPRMSERVRGTSILFTEILIWVLPFNALITVLILALNAHNRFALAAAVYPINTLLFICSVLLLAPRFGAIGLPIAGLVGPLVTAPLLIGQLARMGLLYPLRLDLSRALIGSFWQLSRPLVWSLGIGGPTGLLMVSHLLLRSFAADYHDGAIAALGYAFRLYELPISLIVNPVATLVFPSITALYISGQMSRISEICRHILMLGLVVLFPAAVIIWAGADLIVDLLLRWGQFNQEAAQLTANALRGFAPAIIAEAAFVLLFRIFYAIQRSKETVLIAFLTIVALFIMLLATAHIAFVAIPLALSVAFTGTSASLIIMLIYGIDRTAVPEWSQLAPWLLSAFVGLTALWLVVGNFPKNMWSEFSALVAFSCGYIAAVSVLLPNFRCAALRILRGII